MDAPRIRHAQADGASIAYQAFGGGPRVFVLIPAFAHNIELIWQQPQAVEFFERLASMGRVLHFDKRGSGRSDRRLPPPSLEDRTSDLEAVLDAEGVERAVLVGTSEGGTLATFFAATYPDRTEALVLKGAYATLLRSADHPSGRSMREWNLRSATLRPIWGRGHFYIRYMAPSGRKRDGFRRWAANFEAGSLLGSNTRKWAQLNQQLDIRGVLDAVQPPTLVTHTAGDPIVPIASGHYLAEHIPNSQFIELPGSDHVPYFAANHHFLDALEDFIAHADPDRSRRGRSLATLLFTDIVGSTELAVEAGDERWMELLNRHDSLTRDCVEAADGRWIKSTGDGVLATFENPSQAIRCAVEVGGRVARECDFEIRAGLHTAEIELRGDDVGGIAVHEAARVQAEAGAGEVLVSQTTRTLVNGGGISFESRGKKQLKGLPGESELFRVAV